MKFSHLESVALSDQGRKRQRNEDSFVAIPDLGVYCVADGMGGVSGGDVASRCIQETVTQAFQTTDKQAVASFRGRTGLYVQAIEAASRWIKHYAEERGLQDMGSTVLAVLFDQRDVHRALALHAGDSRLYRMRDNALTQITRDHTVAAALGRSEQSLPVSFRNRLTKAVGLAETADLEKTAVEVRKGDLYLLCSDGLSRMVSERQLLKTLRQGLLGDLKDFGEELIRQANAAGGDDNITIVLVRVGMLEGIDVEHEIDPETKTPDTACEVPTMVPESQVIVAAPSEQRPTDTDTVEGVTPCTPATPHTPIEALPVAATLEPPVEPTLVPPPSRGSPPQPIPPVETDKVAAPRKPIITDTRQSFNAPQSAATASKLPVGVKFKKAAPLIAVGLIIGVGGLVTYGLRSKSPSTIQVVSSLGNLPPPKIEATILTKEGTNNLVVALTPPVSVQAPSSSALVPSVTSTSPVTEAVPAQVLVQASNTVVAVHLVTNEPVVMPRVPPIVVGNTETLAARREADRKAAAAEQKYKLAEKQKRDAEQTKIMQFVRDFPAEVDQAFRSGKWRELACKVEDFKLTSNDLAAGGAYSQYAAWYGIWKLVNIEDEKEKYSTE